MQHAHLQIPQSFHKRRPQGMWLLCEKTRNWEKAEQEDDDTGDQSIHRDRPEEVQG
jgi:hypothetical protein